jgi:phage regulator Rha-like protein
VDRDLATLYGVETKVLKQAVKRNIRRFPDDFMLVLTIEETQSSRTQIVTLNNSKTKRGQNIKYQAMAFTEQGVAMLSTVLKSDLAIAISIEIMQVFVKLRNKLHESAFIQSRLSQMEMRIELQDLKIDSILIKTPKIIAYPNTASSSKTKSSMPMPFSATSLLEPSIPSFSSIITLTTPCFSNWPNGKRT